MFLALGGVALSVLMVHTSPATAFAVVGGSGIVGLTMMWRRLGSIDRARRATDPVLLKLARSNPVFSVLPPYAIEQVMHGLVREPFEKESVVMSIGEIGDRLCLLADGSLDVHVGDRVVNRCEPGAFLGEISLLLDVPRTATVTAGSDGAVVYWMRADAFLDAVNRAPRSRARAEAEAGRRLER